MKSRWAGFINFERKVRLENKLSEKTKKEKTVMVGSSEVHDVLPGQHKLCSIIPHLVVRPNFTEIKGVKWITNDKSGKGRIIFPSHFDEHIEIDIGTAENLAYYGATITNTRPDDQVTLSLRHVIEDFTYADNYLKDYILCKNGNNGAGLERHRFSHLDCPMDSDNGIFVLGKFLDQEETILHLTGFQIPAKHCMFIPGKVIHINDYLKGTWRTMLSDAAPIDYVYLEKENKKFHFQFKNRNNDRKFQDEMSNEDELDRKWNKIWNKYGANGAK